MAWAGLWGRAQSWAHPIVPKMMVTEMASAWVGKEKQPRKEEREALSYVSYVGANRAGLASFGGSHTTRKSGRNRW